MDDLFKRPPIASAPLSVVMTVAGIDGWQATVADWVGYLNGLDREYELLLVSERPEVSVDAAAASYAHVRAVGSAYAAGFGAALGRGLVAARMPLLLYTRCEAGYRPQELSKLLKHIDLRDLVAGRRAPGVGRRRSLRLLGRVLFGIRLTDLGCLFLLARRHIFARIPIQSRGEFAHAEVLAKANFLGCLMHDAVVNWQPPVGQEHAPSLGALWPDIRRVFFDPDFGPVDVTLDLASGGLPLAEKQADVAAP